MRKEWHCSKTLDGREKVSPGCMSGMLQYLDFHHLLFTGGGASSSRRTSPESSSSPPRGLHYYASHDKQQLKGVEAPRNSLELDEERATSTSAMEEEFHDVPVGIQIVPPSATSAKNTKNNIVMMLLEEEKRSSQAETPRTPSVVVRLMGLEAMPDGASSPATYGTKTPPLVEQAQKRNKKISKVVVHESGKELYRQPLQSLNYNIPDHLPRFKSDSDAGTRSLPETPRISTSARWNVDPRLSLQLNKENGSYRNKVMQELSYLSEVAGDYSLPASPPSYNAAKSTRKDFERHLQDENKSPRGHYYAREIVKQVKETVTSRREIDGGGSGDGVGSWVEIGSKSKRTKPVDKTSIITPAPSCSPPRTRFSEVRKSNAENHIQKPPVLTKPLHSLSPPSPKHREGSKVLGENKTWSMVPIKSRKTNYDRFNEGIKKTVQAETLKATHSTRSLPALASLSQSTSVKQTSVRKKCSSNPSIVTLRRKEAYPSSSMQPTPHRTHEELPLISRDACSLKPLSTQKNGQLRRPSDQDPEYRYLKSIFQHISVSRSVLTPLFRWYSSSLPIDPIIFHQIELELSNDEESLHNLGSLRHRWNRKLLFRLVQEILGDLLQSTTTTNAISREIKSCCGSSEESMLLLRLWTLVQGCPAADCRVVGDIDALVAGDLMVANIRQLLFHPSVVEEAESVVFEVEQEIIDALLGETASLAACEAERS